MITDKDTIEIDGYTIHLPPKAEGQTHWEIPSISVDDLPLEPKEWRIVVSETRQPTLIALSGPQCE